MATEEQIAEVAERLGRAAPDAVVILFGSHARGDAEEQSDVDLLIVEPEVESAFTETARLERALEGLDVSTDLIVVTRERYDRWADEPCTVVYEAARDGRIVYAPPGSDLRLRPEHRREVTYISEEAIQAVTARLREAAPDATIILFGPYARGKPRPTSDLDILVVEPQVVSRFDETARLAEAVDELDIAHRHRRRECRGLRPLGSRAWDSDTRRGYRREGPPCPRRSTSRRYWPRPNPMSVRSISYWHPALRRSRQ